MSLWRPEPGPSKFDERAHQLLERYPEDYEGMDPDEAYQDAYQRALDEYAEAEEARAEASAEDREPPHGWEP